MADVSHVLPPLKNRITLPTAVIVRVMPGINEADMDRISEFVKRTKFERTPEMLCPNDDEEDAEEESNGDES